MMKKFASAPLFLLTILLLLALAGLSLLLPDQEHSALENRPLAQMPKLELAQVASGRYMDQLESYVNDQLPFRDRFVQMNLLKEMALMRTESHGVLRGRGHRLFNQSKLLDVSDIEKKIGVFAGFAEDAGLPFTLMMVPPSSVVYQEELPGNYPLINPVPTIEKAAAGHPAIQFVPATDAFLLEKQQGMTHYRTDHHLTARGASLVYRLMAEHLGFVPDLTAGNMQELEGFKGSFYSRAPFPFIPADTLTYFDVQGLELEIEGESMPSLVDPSLLDRPNMYAALLYNNPGYLVLHNPGQTGQEALVIRDSNANAVLPLLAWHYKALHVIDFRYLKLGFDLKSLIKTHDIKEVLCIYGTDVFLSDRNMLLHLASSKD